MIAVIDADLISKRNHNFPNLTCMKISGYYKEKGYDVVLKRDYNGLEAFEKVFISKVFTDTPFPDEILKLPNVEYGGTGFFYDKAPNLPDEIEHHMPDYGLYDEYVARKIIKHEPLDMMFIPSSILNDLINCNALEPLNKYIPLVISSIVFSH